MSLGTPMGAVSRCLQLIDGSVILTAGQALRTAGVDISYAQVEKSPGRIALGVFEGTGIFSFAIANVLLPEVPP